MSVRDIWKPEFVEPLNPCCYCKKEVEGIYFDLVQADLDLSWRCCSLMCAIQGAKTKRTWNSSWRINVVKPVYN